MNSKICAIALILITIANQFDGAKISQQKVRNVLLLLADDAAFEMGAYLNRYCQTPNLDAFAKRSLIFNNAFTSVSSCSPSRAQILTGLTSHQSGMYGLHNLPHNFNVFESVKSLPTVLAENNIRSGIIGKKHIGGSENFRFDYEQTEETHSINQIGRNITRIRLYVREFLKNVRKDREQGFFLVVAFHDPHRCGHITPEFGEFCERWGSGEEGMGQIPDWRPIYYDWRNLPYPDYLPQTDVVKQELAAQYMTISRLDQGIGLVLQELKDAHFENETLVIYTSDNGPPFPGGRTNLYDHGIREPMLVHSPIQGARKNAVTYAMTSLLDIYPTVLDAFGIAAENSTSLTGKSFLPLLQEEPPTDPDAAIFGSQNFHECTMNYPMRMIRTRDFKLIHNLAYAENFPIDQDVYTSGTFQQILNMTIARQAVPWVKSLRTYYKRPEWEMYDIRTDPLERWNLAEKPSFKEMRAKLQKRLKEWQGATADPWRCSPHAVLQDKGPWRDSPECLTLGHDSL